MALNRYMHPRNIYKSKKPNFEELAGKNDFFREIAVKNEAGRTVIDFKMPSHLAALSKALLINDFGLDVDLPRDRLVPTIPLRLNYILWIEDLIKDYHSIHRPVNILDIGVGASCIYPLLGAKCNQWNIFGTESDLRSYKLATENVNRNMLQKLITLYHIDENSSSLDTVFQSIADETFYLDAVMSNPPFFCDASDVNGPNNYRTLNRPPPKTLSLATPNECQTFGGEVYFCMRLARDSVRYSTRVGVFTIMLGRKCSVAPVRRILHKLKIPKISIFEMCQGRIMRWGVAWSFLPHIQFPESEFRRLRKLDRPPLVLQLPPVVSCLPFYTINALLEWLRNEFKQLNMIVLEQKNRSEIGGLHFMIIAHSNTWTGYRRKRREMERHLSKENHHPTDTLPNVVHCSLSSELALHQPIRIDVKQNSLKHSLPPSYGEIQGTNLPDKRTCNDSNLTLCDDGEDAWLDDDSLGNLDVRKIEQQQLLLQQEEPIIKANVYVEYLDTDYHLDEKNDDVDDDNADPSCGQKTNPLLMKISWLGGTCREADNQILCYLKNRLK